MGRIKGRKTAALTGISTVAVLALLAGLAGTPVLAQQAQPAPQQQGEGQELEEIVITGTYIRRPSQAGMASPIQVVGRENLEDIGAFDIADLTQTLTINNGAQNNPDAFTQNLTTGTSNINLRGLGVQSTLVLVNGKRQPSSAAPTDGGLLFVDTASLMPMIAVDRVEILKDGASALYGSDAVAGVVNFITRDDFTGFEMQAEFSAITNQTQNDVKISGIWGGGNDRTHVVIAASYLNRTPLFTFEKDLRPLDKRGPNGLSVADTTGQPGNIVIPAIPVQAVLGGLVDPGTFAAFQQAYDQFTPFVVNPITGQLVLDGSGNPIPNIDPVTGQFLGFNQASDGIADGLTATVLAGLGVPGFILDQIAAAQAQQTGSTFQTPFFADPGCEAAAQKMPWVLPDFQTINGVNVGLCQYDFYPFFTFVPDETRLKSFAKVTHEVSHSLELYGEFYFSRNRATRNTSNFPITRTIPLPGIGSAFVGPDTTTPSGQRPAAYPFNPFKIDALYVGRSPGIGQIEDFFTNRPNDNSFRYDTWHFTGGARGDIGDTGWYYDVSYSRGINDYKLLSSDGLRDETLLALQGLGGKDCNPVTGIPGVGPCQFYNIFGSGFLADPNAKVPVFDVDGNPIIDPATGEQVLAPVRNSKEILDFINGEIVIDGRSDITVVDAVVSGDLFNLPAGPVGLALGFQYRDERLAWDLDDNTNRGNFLFVSVGVQDFDQSRDVAAFFGELNLPLFENFNVQAAVRYEDYGGQTGDTVDPKVSVLYQPTTWLALRGSYGTSFRAPSLFQSFGNQTTLNSVLDPRTGERSFFAIRTIGDPALKPETSRAWNAGVTLTPIEGLNIDVDHWRFFFRNVIIEESPDDIAFKAFTTNPEFIGTKVFLDPNTGALVQINTNFVNAAFIRTNGFDLNVSYTFDSPLGIFRPGFEATYVADYEAPLGPGGAKLDVADRRNRQNFLDPVPDWRFNASLAWLKGGHQAVVFVRYIDSFLDDENTVFATQPNGLPDFSQVIDPVKVGSHTTVDAQYSYTFGGFGPVESMTITIGAINLFNNQPPFVNTDGAFESRTHDPRGRLVYARLKVGF
ncbi:MAG: hypothetical protein KatS3mg119_0643 [Rhodothalassiaceae bacterium]|nr:MAG: hypothetical protein KatS3mg119_0643 [Rhodothalassiaceae bacterium]